MTHSINYPKYPYPISDLIDRLSIVQLKAINIHDLRDEYHEEMDNISKDIDYIAEKRNLKLSGDLIRAILVIALTNQCIWMNESKARGGGKEQDTLLKFTHSVNGIRNTAKNMVSQIIGDRIDLKIDCLAADFQTKDFIQKHGNWNIFETWESKK